MCETRKGRVTVANTLGPGKWREAIAAATADAASHVGDNEKLVADTVRIDGPGSPRHDDENLMDFHYTCTVMVPGCSGWSTPVT